VADVFVSSDWLARHLEDPAVVVVDVRQPFFYAQAHIPGAVNVPLMFLASADGGPPSGEALARALGQAGITPDTHVVGYDEGASDHATRLYWTLTLYGHGAVSVLDGGITAWRHAGFDWAYEQTVPSPTYYPVPRPQSGAMKTTEDLKTSLEGSNRAIIDTRSPGEYLGVRATAMRNGHVPGAVNIDWSANLRQDDGIALTDSPDALRALYATAGATPDKHVTVYCASGMRASYTFAVLKSLGYPEVDIYIPGWNEWGNRDDTPMEEG
jgi:thiosulfate/3-mercaptopyruvate sulfurtransferase